MSMVFLGFAVVLMSCVLFLPLSQGSHGQHSVQYMPLKNRFAVTHCFSHDVALFSKMSSTQPGLMYVSETAGLVFP